jgi:hypothetical protein
VHTAYLSQNPGAQSRLFEKLDGELSRNDTETFVIGGLEELSEYFLLLRCEDDVEVTTCS